jgi:hypothetical protein
MPIARSTPAYVFIYIVLMVPTYILPYFGSNSTLVNAFSTALGMGPTPQWWAHAWTLTMLCLLAWARSGAVNRTWLPVLPILASAFDLTPGLSSIPLMPTLLHIGGILAGVIGASSNPDAESATDQTGLSRMTRNTAAVATLCAIGGAGLFMVTAKNNVARANASAASTRTAPPTLTPSARTAPAATLTLPSLAKPTEVAPPEPAPSPAANVSPVARDNSARKKEHHRPAVKHQAPVGDEKTTKSSTSGATTRYIRLND